MLAWFAANWTEVLGFATGLACVALAARRNVATFPIGIANNLVFLALFTEHALYADAGLQVVYLALGVAGWIGWVRGRRESAFVRGAPRRAVPWLVLAFGTITAVLWLVLHRFTDSTTELTDAATTAGSLVAQYMLNRRWLENWIVWISVDVVFVGLFAVKGLWITAALYLVFIALCVGGHRSWARERAMRTLAPGSVEAAV